MWNFLETQLICPPFEHINSPKHSKFHKSSHLFIKIKNQIKSYDAWVKQTFVGSSSKNRDLESADIRKSNIMFFWNSK